MQHWFKVSAYMYVYMWFGESGEADASMTAPPALLVLATGAICEDCGWAADIVVMVVVVVVVVVE
jgi:hypothetical protein